MNHEHLVSLVTRVRTAQRELDEALAEARQTCPHARVIECSYTRREYVESTPPARGCLDCGVWEEGWAAGYHVLPNRTEELNGLPINHNMTRDEWWRLFKVPLEQWGMCWGNRSIQQHAVPRHRLKFSEGTRCCAEHSLV